MSNQSKTVSPKRGKREPHGPRQPSRQRPNHFIGLRIEDEQLITKLEEMQAHLLNRSEVYNEYKIKPCTFHITMGLFDIEGDDIKKAINAMEKVKPKLEAYLEQNPFSLDVKGMGHFYNRVLFAKINNETHLRVLTGLFEESFREEGITVTSEAKNAKFHLTVFKITGKNKFRFDQEDWAPFKSQTFGSQSVNSFQLLRMSRPKAEDGYYGSIADARF